MIFLIAKVLFWIIGIMFLVGLVGSGVVVILTSIEDVKELREKKAGHVEKMVEDHSFRDVFPVPSGNSASLR
jgi:hypothetical protein